MCDDEPLGKVLIIGGCGFLGHHIVQQLLASQRASVVVFDISTSRNRWPDVTYYDGNIGSVDDVQKVLREVRPQVIIHTTSPTPHRHDLATYLRVNVEGTRTLIRCALEVGTVHAFVYTSSSSVIHDNASDLIEASEEWPILHGPEQSDPYAYSKGVTDAMVLNADDKERGFLTCTIRPASVFGPGDTGISSAMMSSAKAGKNKYQIGDGKNLFDFVYVENVAAIHVSAASSLLHAHRSHDVADDMRVNGEAFFVTNDQPTSFWEFSRAMGAAAGYPTPREDVLKIPCWIAMIMAIINEWTVWLISAGSRRAVMNRQAIRYTWMTRTFKIDKAKTRLGYRPHVSLEEGIRRSGIWWKQCQGLLDQKEA